MKSFKNMLMIVAIFAVASMNAKQMGARRTMPGGGAPVTQPVIAPVEVRTEPMPNAAPKYKHLLAEINDKSNSTMMNNNSFTQNMIKTIKSANITSTEKIDLFEAGAKAQNGLAQTCANNKNAFLYEMNQLKGSMQIVPYTGPVTEEEMSEEEMRMRRE
jgi:hypothetical protein